MAKWDRKSEEEISKLHELSDLARSDQWKSVKRLLVEKIADLMNIGNIDGETAEKIATQVGQNKGAAEILAETIREIEGSKTKLDALLKENRDGEGYVKNEDEE